MARFSPTIEHEVGYPGVRSFNGWIYTLEQTFELRWPNNVWVYDRMRKSDAQVASVLRAVGLPIRRTNWHVRGDDCDPRVVQFVETELGLTPEQQGRRRRRGHGISWDDYLRHALLMLPFGHMYFEQVYSVGPPAPDQTSLAGQMAHLAKLAPRLPTTISGFDIALTGELEAVRQYLPPGNPMPSAVTIGGQVQIPADRLVAFVLDQEGSDWTGNSILRSCYKHWLIKDQLLKLGAMSVERNGMGLPVVYFDEASGSKQEALNIATSARAGEQAGVALQDGVYRLELEGVTGQTKDELPLVKYHDESVGREALAMFLNLGHDRGSQSLGQTFMDFFLLGLGAIIAHLEETTTEEVVRDLVELNFGPDEPYPEVVADEITPDSVPFADGLKALADSGLLTPDRDLEQELRRRAGLPSLPDDVPQRPAPVVYMPQTEPGPVPAGEEPPGPQSVTQVPSAAAGATLEELERRLADVQARLAARRAS